MFTFTPSGDVSSDIEYGSNTFTYYLTTVATGFGAMIIPWRSSCNRHQILLQPFIMIPTVHRVARLMTAVVEAGRAGRVCLVYNYSCATEITITM